MSEREGVIIIFIGTNGVGKSTAMKEFLPVNKRNLILPANRNDPAWHGNTELKDVCRQVPNKYTGKDGPEFSYPEIGKFKGNKVVHVDSTYRNEMFQPICHTQRGFTNGGLFLDDFKNYIPAKGSVPGYVRNLFGGRRHLGLDIFMACWSFSDINIDFWTFNPQLVVHRTTMAPNNSVRDKIGQDKYNELCEMVARVNKAAKNDYYYSEIFKL